MTTVIQQEEQDIRIPAWVCDLASFRRWAKSDDFPERGWYAHVDGELWVDLSTERLGHNQVKNAVGAKLTLTVEGARTGRFIADRMLLTNVEAGLSTEPDGMFLSFETLRSGRVRFSKGEDSTEVEGTPDMVLEVVSPNSKHKDTVVLRQLYWRAGIPEYWIAEPRRDEVSLQILKHGPRGYAAVRNNDGWLRSVVFRKAFHLSREIDPIGDPIYRLGVR